MRPLSIRVAVKCERASDMLAVAVQLPAAGLEASAGATRVRTAQPADAKKLLGKRLEAALRALYGYYARLEPLLVNIQRDAPVLRILRELNAYRARYLEDVRELLLVGWPSRGQARTRLRRALGHALDFRTWQSLVHGQGCRADEAVQLMLAFAHAAAEGKPRG